MGWIADLLQEIPSAARYKSELEAMEKQNATLKSEVTNLRQEIQRRNEIIQREKSNNSRLEEIKEKILQLLSIHEEADIEQILHALSANVQVVTFHLTELEDLNLVHPSYIINSPVIWSIAHKGRKYLITHGLLK